MDPGELVAVRPVEEAQHGLVIGGVVAGAVSLAAVLTLGVPRGAVVATASAAIFYAVAWGLVMGLLARRQWRRVPPPPVAVRVDPPGTSPILSGVLTALAVGVATTAALLAVDALLGEGPATRTVLGLVPGGLFGVAIASAIGFGELRRWQDEHGLDLHTRRGAARVMWTRAQARERLVVVPRPGTPTGPAASHPGRPDDGA